MTIGWRSGRCSLATIVDATDGVLARRVRVKEVLPDFDGARIDDIVDYITFVFLPMLLLEGSGGLDRWTALPVIAVVLMSSMYGFVAPDAKSSDHFFTGFPSYWNIVVLYLMLFRVPPLVNALVLLALSALVFVRIGYVYPSRTPTLRALTLTLGSAWAVLVGAIIVMWPSPPRWMAIGSLAFPVYYTVLSLVLHARRTVRGLIRPRFTQDRVLSALYACLVVVTAIVVIWSMRQGWAVYKLRRGVGDTWFYCRRRQPLVPDGRAAPRRVARPRSRPICSNAFIAVEDHRFYHHLGIDPIALGRAVWRDVARRRRSEGGSTLTQQLARTLFLSNKKTPRPQGAGSGARAADRAGALARSRSSSCTSIASISAAASTASRRCRGTCSASRRAS